MKKRLQDQTPYYAALSVPATGQFLSGDPTESNDPQRALDPPPLASLSVSTENLGDHIQIISGLDLLARFGLSPRIYLDRDFELKSAPGLEAGRDHPILLNGWFKRDSSEWPPHPRLVPIFLGFHIRLFQCPSLLSEESLAHYYHAHQPIGCRDRHTAELLGSKGVETFESHCLSMTFPRRLPAASQSEVLVVSRDDRLAQAMPASLGPFTQILHYSGDTDFARNMARARSLLEIYRDRARLIVLLTSLHCIVRCRRWRWGFRWWSSIPSTRLRDTVPIRRDSRPWKASCQSGGSIGWTRLSGHQSAPTSARSNCYCSTAFRSILRAWVSARPGCWNQSPRRRFCRLLDEEGERSMVSSKTPSSPSGDRDRWGKPESYSWAQLGGSS